MSPYYQPRTNRRTVFSSLDRVCMECSTVKRTATYTVLGIGCAPLLQCLDLLSFLSSTKW